MLKEIDRNVHTTYSTICQVRTVEQKKQMWNDHETRRNNGPHNKDVQQMQLYFSPRIISYSTTNTADSLTFTSFKVCTFLVTLIQILAKCNNVNYELFRCY